MTRCDDEIIVSYFFGRIPCCAATFRAVLRLFHAVLRRDIAPQRRISILQILLTDPALVDAVESAVGANGRKTGIELCNEIRVLAFGDGRGER